MAALPAVWLVNKEDDSASSRPSVAAVGLAPGSASTTETTQVVDPMAVEETIAEWPSILDGPSAPPVPAHVAIAVGGSEDALVATAKAIYRRSVARLDTCLYNGVPSGSYITVVNVDNGRSTQCWTGLRPPDEPADELVMHPDNFTRLAELINAPIHVEIRQ